MGAHAPGIAPSDTITAVTSARALIIDDEPGVRALLETLVELSGYQPTIAADGSRGLARFAAGHYALLLTISSCRESAGGTLPPPCGETIP
jgi:DNA-binding NtrC family response regulator